MTGRTFADKSTSRGEALLALVTVLLLAAVAVACESEPDRPSSPAGDASPTATPAPTPAGEEPFASQPVAVLPSPTPDAQAASVDDMPLAPKPSLSPTTPADTQFPARVEPPPAADLIELARRFRPGEDSRLAVAPELGPDDVGHVEEFWIVDLTRLRVEQVRATLQHVTPRALWYTVDGVNAPTPQLAALAEHYEERVYPAVAQATLGYVPERSSDGIGAPTTMLLADLSGAAGYFAPTDYYTAGVFPYSNGRPMLYLDARVVRAGARAFGSLTGHELQHLLHQHIDPTEHTWVNEGISEVTAGIVARGRPINPPGFRDEVSLTNWPGFEAGVGRNYNTAHLFFAYFTQRYGVDSLAQLVARPEDGALGIDAYLREAERPQTFDRLFMDWATANLLGGRARMPYGYDDSSILSELSPRHTLAIHGSLRGEVAPFAADYVRLDVPAEGADLNFSGNATSPIFDTAPFSGEACWWSNRGDTSHTRLTREFDLSAVTEAALSFRMWHNIEEKWDYMYVTASADRGETWHVLSGTHTITDDPIGATYGPGITGRSDGWVEERMDLTPFAGGSVLISFEQVSDAAISLDGACIDDIAIAAIGFHDDAESDGEWEADGFVRTNNLLDQRFGVRLVIERPNDNPAVLDLTLDATNIGSLRIPALAEGETATVIVASQTQYTRLGAEYTLRLSPFTS